MTAIMDASPFVRFIGTFLAEESALPLFWAVFLHLTVFIGGFAYVVSYLDRKLAADTQMRIGPNRVGPLGLLQALADCTKYFTKQDMVPRGANGALFRWGPVFAIAAVTAALGPIPMAQEWAMSDLEWGLLYSLLMIAITQFFVFLAGYASASPWSVVGAFRLIVSLASFLVPVALSMASAMLVAGGASFSAVVSGQGGGPWNWMIFNYPPTILSMAVMWAALFVWQSRGPFDNPYGGTEIASGYGAEYSGLRYAFLRALQLLQLLLSSYLIATVFLGGWHFPLPLDSLGRAANLVQYLFFSSKVLVLILIGTWVRWSLPRMRVDQVVYVCWKVLTPAALLGLALTAVWLVVFRGNGVGSLL